MKAEDERILVGFTAKEGAERGKLNERDKQK